MNLQKHLRCRVADFKRIWSGVLDHRLLDEHFFNYSIVYHHAVPPTSFSKTTFAIPNVGHAHASSEECCSVRDKFHIFKTKRTRSLVFREALVQPPLAHNKCLGANERGERNVRYNIWTKSMLFVHTYIVHTQTVDFVYAKGQNGLVICFVAWQVGRTAGWSEGSRESKQYYAFPLEVVIGGPHWILKRYKNKYDTIERVHQQIQSVKRVRRRKEAASQHSPFQSKGFSSSLSMRTRV